MNNLKIDGTEYELIPIQDGVTLHHSTPFVSIGGKIFVGEAMPIRMKLPEYDHTVGGETRDWEVLSFRLEGTEYTTGKEGKYKRDTTNIKYLDNLPSNYKEVRLSHVPSTAEILSVKRLSDGEVFSIGDYLEGHKSAISQIKNGSHNPRQEFTSGGNYIWLSTLMSYNGSCLSIAKKRKEKKIILTTQDGVEIYEDEKDRIVYSLLTKGSWEKDERKAGAFPLYSNKGKWLNFSTELARYNYELQNRPSISINRILEIIGKTCSVSDKHKLDFYLAEIKTQICGLQ